VSLFIPSSVTTMKYYYAFDGCDILTLYCEAKSKPSGWTGSFSCGVVWNCNTNDVTTKNLIYVMIDGIRYRLENGNAIVDKQPLSGATVINIPASVTYKGIEYPVTAIYSNAFENFVELESIVIPNSIKSIGSYAFSNCTNLTNVVIPNNEMRIPSYVFTNCTSLTSIIIPENITDVESNAFYGCINLNSFIVDENNAKYISIDGVLYQKDSSTEELALVCYPAAKIGLIFQIPDNVTSIRNYAFSFCQILTKVIASDSLRSISTFAFYNCSSLTTVDLTKNVTFVNDSAFYHCIGVTIQIPIGTQTSNWDQDWASEIYRILYT